MYLVKFKEVVDEVLVIDIELLVLLVKYVVMELLLEELDNDFDVLKVVF